MAADATVDLASVDVPQLEALVAQFYGAGTQEQVRAAARARAPRFHALRAHAAATCARRVPAGGLQPAVCCWLLATCGGSPLPRRARGGDRARR